RNDRVAQLINPVTNWNLIVAPERPTAAAKEQIMRKADPYETRARELALAAGVDPDSRIGEGRGMPAWGTVRDAAPQEHLVKEAAAVELPPQAPQYRNSPLKVFGEHDEGTLAQMRNCMSVGNVVAGTICADGHLGYAQPVGGVIAYEGQLSI